MRVALRAKLTNDLITTVGDLCVLGKHSGKAEPVCGDQQIHRPIGREVLAVAALANAGGQRFCDQLKTHCAAKTTTGSFSHDVCLSLEWIEPSGCETPAITLGCLSRQWELKSSSDHTGYGQVLVKHFPSQCVSTDLYLNLFELIFRGLTKNLKAVSRETKYPPIS